MADLGLTGIFSGIDTDLLIAHTIAANSTRLNTLTLRKSEQQAEVSALNEMEGALANLQYAANALRDASTLRQVTASTTDSDVAYAASGTAEGAFAVHVEQLAAADRQVHDGVITWTHTKSVSGGDDEYLSADDISGNTGTDYKFIFQFSDEAEVTVDLSAYDATGITLNELISEINTAAGYTAATTVQDGDEYLLGLQAQNAAKSTVLTVTDDDSVNLLDNINDFAQTADSLLGTGMLIGAGQFVYTYDGTTRTITTTADTTFGEFLGLINNDAGNPGVRASSLLHQGVHLVLAGQDTGEDFTITVEAATTLEGFATGDWTETQTAQNAKIQVDGYPNPDFIERSSNTVTDVLPGTLHLTGTGDTTITLSRTTATLKQNLTNLAAVLNTVKTKIDTYTGYNQADETSGVLQGDYFLNGVFNQIRAALIQPAAGFLDGSETFTLANQIGLEADRYGEFSFDEAAFDEAVAEDYQAVLNLIGAVATGAVDSSDIQFTSAGESTQGGTYDLKVEYDAVGDIASAQIKLEDEDTYRDLDVAGATLTGVYGNPEQYLMLTVVSGGTSETRNYTVRVRQGIAGQIYDRLQDILDEVDGTLATKLNGYSNATDSGSIDIIDQNIEREEIRLEEMEERLVAQYARLEATLARLDAQRGAFDSLFAALESNKESD